MKSLYLLFICLTSLIANENQKQTNILDLNVLVGTWRIDLSPEDTTDDNFAMMKITKVEGKSFKGEFYRKGVKIKNAQINTQLGIIKGALISGDGTGTYNTAFYLKDDVLHGTTHAVDRNFLSVWTATKTK